MSARIQHNLISFQTLVRREIKRFMRIWIQAFFPPLITMTLYFVIFGNFIGSHVGTIENVTYMQYIAPGLIMMSIITASFNNVVGSVYIMRFVGNISELLVTPTPNHLLLLGFTVGGMIRGLIVGFLITLVALFFTHLTVHNILVTVIVCILTAMFFSLAGFANALYAKNWDGIATIPTFVLTPLTYLGGVFFSINQLPHSWRMIAQLNPILYIINSFRYGILGVSDIPISIGIIMVILATAVMYGINMYLLKIGKGLRT